MAERTSFVITSGQRILLMVLSSALVMGCSTIEVQGDVKTSSTSILSRLLIGSATVVGAGVCWYFREQQPVTWIGVIGLPLFAVFVFLAPTIGTSC